jgi:hypothetical protein
MHTDFLETWCQTLEVSEAYVPLLRMEFNDVPCAPTVCDDPLHILEIKLEQMRIAEHELKQELFAWEDKSLWVGPTNRNQQLVVMRLVMVVKLLREFAPEGSRCMVRRKHESNFESKPREKGTEGKCTV